ncbi:squalene/phytoene synthase family protein [Actinomadura roseirufa]|uniref:squalene/phytoene synthase family protein n=1 Tax=Actinomadura roseirufa TaxID=2094049 RepID=UPI0013F17DC3|nr:squalene/phytoene synthase family protein [Actinomadura roseirufa]
MTHRELDSAGITGPVRTGYLVASDLLAKKARARGAPFLIRYLVSVRKRPYLEVLFAFITYLDDIVDDRSRGVAVRNWRLDRLEAAFDAAVEGERASAADAEDRVNGALTAALVHFMRTWDLPLTEAREYLATQRRILEQREFVTYAALEKEYLDPMAPPAIWANTFFEPRAAGSHELCRAATRSFQLIDFIWDLREDLALGRLFLPLEHLALFDLDREGLERQLDDGPFSPALRELLAHEVERAGALLDSALDWPRTIAPAARPFAEWDLEMNRLKLAELRRGAFEDLVGRSVTSRTFKPKAAARTLYDVGRAVAGRRGDRPAAAH